MLEMQPEVLESIILVAGAHRMSEEGRDILLEDDFDKADKEFQEYYLKIHFNDTARIAAMFADIRSMTEQVPTTTTEVESKLQKLSRTKVPAFLVWGDRDIYFPVEIAEELYMNLQNARLWVVPEQGHTPVWKAMGGDKQAVEIFPGTAADFFLKGRK